jgi:aspartyl-tRNA(Asn)/glutamyl-tRNA(Gln) amidotransferase subunit C
LAFITPASSFPLETCRAKLETPGMAAAELDVKYVAHLARISLSPDEEKKLGDQLAHILGYIEKLKELDVTKVVPTAHAVPMVNVVRADEVRPSLSHEAALLNAPRQSGGLFIVPKIVE